MLTAFVVWRGGLDTLQCVTLGMDLIQSSYPFELSERALALALPFATLLPAEGVTPEQQQQHEQTLFKRLNGVITLNLRDNALATDPAPLLEGCRCYACTRHTRAYLHHLVAAHEMLGDTLLATHNLFQFQELFRVLRAAIARGVLPRLVESLRAALVPADDI